jgi:predicted PurR-regulated permease PerM
LLLFAGLLVFGWWGLLVPVLVLLLGVVAVRWYDAWQRMRDLIRWRRLTLAQRQDIRSARQILLKKLDESAMNT